MVQGNFGCIDNDQASSISSLQLPATETQTEDTTIGYMPRTLPVLLGSQRDWTDRVKAERMLRKNMAPMTLAQHVSLFMADVVLSFLSLRLQTKLARGDGLPPITFFLSIIWACIRYKHLFSSLPRLRNYPGRKPNPDVIALLLASWGISTIAVLSPVVPVLINFIRARLLFFFSQFVTQREARALAEEIVRNLTACLISVPAGRCHRRDENSNWVDPHAEKGLVLMRLEDDLMHFSWKSRESNRVEDELIIFPGEATFESVSQDPTGRTHILKFNSSTQKYFFWFQRRDRQGDLRAQVDINALLQDPSYQPGNAPLPDQTPERDWPPTPGAPRLSNPEPAPASASAGTSSSVSDGANKENAARLFVVFAQAGILGQFDHDSHLNEVLSPSVISDRIKQHSKLVAAVVPLLPPDSILSENPTADDVVSILTTPQYNEAIGALDQALRNRTLSGQLMTELGLPDNAKNSVKAFLDALDDLSTQKGQAQDDRMDED
ncbi:hypothetical protein L204_101394 [Cryptococcus depauperatus]